MEGLLPMVYKSLKKNKTRRQYQCLSSSSAVPITHTYNIADFYIKKDDRYVIPGPDKVSAHGGPAHHRRYNSVCVGGSGGRGFGLEEEEVDAKPKQQLVRFRSHRMFSCVTGA
ncbi:hypothetical protein DH2020_027636 [Rehmannia glutinosa]|uniref:Uncharacterized protein n=1 Tax=Rehmannia glutinosa TaxID=99300 RepID=A0ABR0VWJ7_REHGL